MFCHQCEQTVLGQGCTNFGVCGKDPETSILQDLAVDFAIRLARTIESGVGASAPARNDKGMLIDALVATATNINFDPGRLTDMVLDVNRRLAVLDPSTPSAITFKTMYSEVIKLGREEGVLARVNRRGEHLAGLEEFVLYGLKGAACYLRDGIASGDPKGRDLEEALGTVMVKALTALGKGDRTADQLVDLSLEIGRATEAVLRGVAAIRSERLGVPGVVTVSTGHVPGKAVLVSGHDLFALEAILKATAGTDIHVYTHGELLTAHAYPTLRAHKHLVGHFGGSWQNQAQDFDSFPGAIVVTTNCLQRPLQSYRRRMFTVGSVAWPGVAHIENEQWGPVLAAARDEKGFIAASVGAPRLTAAGTSTVARKAREIADRIADGSVRRVFVVGGCDGTTSRRNYFAEFAEKVPGDCLVWTFACGKFRMNVAPASDGGDWARFMDVGQCSDFLSILDGIDAVAQNLKRPAVDVPVSFIMSWYEQKAVAYLQILLARGMRGVRLGPTLPAFLSEETLTMFRERFGLRGISKVDTDLSEALKGA